MSHPDLTYPPPLPRDEGEASATFRPRITRPR